MIWVIVIFVLLAAALLEYYSVSLAPKRMQISFDTDLTLAEPGEEVCLSFVIRNQSRLPQLYVSVSVSLEDGLRISVDEDARAKYIVKTASGNLFRRRYFLLPHQAVTQKIRFVPEHRGVFHIGRCYLECGDYLGLKSIVQSFPIDRQLVCTARYIPDLPSFDPLGGTDGNHSVRRFIFEDPTLIYGYRDYTGREPMRQISWKATARTGRLTVREQDHTQEWNATVLADLWTDSPDDLERVLELVRTVCESLEERHIPYAFVSNSDLGDVPKGLGRQHIHMIQRKIGLSFPIAYYRFDTLLPRLFSGPTDDRSFILIAPEPTRNVDDYLQYLDRYGASKTIVFYGKEAVS
ncbi:MAG: DUF58 domain-containing protein [Clostridiales bacterium]|nr:DUF58 domain-containing protein [Clostridiales bacterium]